MKAIVAKYYGPTNVRGSRIKVYAEGVPAKWYSYDSKASDGGAEAYIHHYAASLGWNDVLAFGILPDGSTVGVFI